MIRQGRLGCENCRKRRIKCNRLHPRCSQCTRAGLRCSGYRSQLDLSFQDQTASITQKYQKPDVVPVPKQLPTPAPSPPLIIFAPRPPVEEIAWRYYFQYFNIMRRGNILPADCRPFIQNDSSSSVSSVVSVGLAAMALIHNDPHLMRLARQKYSAALRLLMEAIGDPKEITKAPTVTSSFNLSMFEMMVHDDRSTPLGWLRHMHGTTTLLRFLPVTPSAATGEVEALLQIAYTSALACLICERPIPPYLTNLVREGGKSPHAANLYHAINLFTILCDLVNLHIETSSSTSVGSTRSRSRSEIATAASCSYQSLLRWTTSLPTDWTDPIHHAHFPGITTEPWIMRIWVYYRLCRILAHFSIVRNMELSHDPTTGTEVGRESYAESIEMISQASRDLYVGIPAMLGSPGLSSNVYFLITILQSMVRLTGRQAVMENWESRVAGGYCEGCSPVQRLVLERLMLI